VLTPKLTAVNFWEVVCSNSGGVLVSAAFGWRGGRVMSDILVGSTYFLPCLVSPPPYLPFPYVVHYLVMQQKKISINNVVCGCPICDNCVGSLSRGESSE